MDAMKNQVVTKNRKNERKGKKVEFAVVTLRGLCNLQKVLKMNAMQS